jgi:hypothetical protein
MRYLHRVRPHESFIASGVYQYFEDDNPSGMVEHWSIHQLPDRSQIVRVDRDGRDSTLKNSLLMEALRSPEGSIERCDIRVYYANGKAAHEARATYNFTHERVEIGRTIDAQERVDEIVELPSQAVIYPPANVFIGGVATQIAAQVAGKTAVFVPNTDTQSTQLLGGAVKEYAAHFLGDESIDIKGKVYAARQYQFVDVSDNLASSLWLDEHDVLIRSIYRNANNRVTTSLTQYARKL